jgi:hypothetical protein
MIIIKNALCSLALFLVPLFAQAQIDLDHPLRISQTDLVYRSVSDPGTVYAFPKALVRFNQPLIVSEGDRLKATFAVGVNPEEIFELRKALDQMGMKDTQVRFIRPLNMKIIPASGTNLPESFHPVVTAVDDPASLGGAVEYRVDVDFAKSWPGRSKGMKLLETIFGESGMDHIATVSYEFNAIAMGAPFLGKTDIPLFVGKRSFQYYNHQICELEMKTEKPMDWPEVDVVSSIHCR